jgi:hypothetical protein
MKHRREPLRVLSPVRWEPGCIHLPTQPKGGKHRARKAPVEKMAGARFHHKESTVSRNTLIALTVVGALSWVCIYAVVVYVVSHFIAKFW